jgi:subtilisin family serine protease
VRRLGVGIALALASVGAVSGHAAIDPTSSGAIRLQQQAPQYVPGEVIVRFRAGVGRFDRAEVVQETGAERKQWLRAPRTELLELPGGTSVEGAVRALEAEPDVLYAEPNWIYRKAVTPNDPRFGSLWGLNQPSDADIDAPEAWDETTGSDAVTVAVVDTGIAYDHPDLAPNMWVNPADPAGGGDDDHNGLQDDIRGWDFF